MTESVPLPGKPENPAPSAAAGLESAGALLRRMREAAGMDAGVLAGALKVSVQKIKALEADSLEQLPNLTFARGLAGAICRALRTDAAPVLARMPVAVAAELHEQAQTVFINQPFRRSGEGPAPMIAGRPSKSLLILAGVVFLGLALLALWPALPVQLGLQHSEAADDEEQDRSTPLLPVPAFASESTPALAASEAAAQEAPVPAAAQETPAPAAAEDAAASLARSAPVSTSGRHATAASSARNKRTRNAAAAIPARKPPPAFVPAAQPRAVDPVAPASAAYHRAPGIE